MVNTSHAANAADAAKAAKPNRPVVQRRVLRDGVYDAVLEMLLEGRVAPGASLSIDGLAAELGVSPTPVREALVELEHTGLVTRAALRGYQVSPPLSTARMAELMDARCVVEVAAITRAVPAAPAVIADLEVAHANHRAASAEVRKLIGHQPGPIEWPTLRKYYTVDWDFHLVILRNCGNPYLLDMAADLAPFVHRLRQSMNHGAVDVDQAHAEHGAILNAIRSGDPDAAAAAMTTHLVAVRSRALADG